MKFTPSSTPGADAFAASGSAGGPQWPGPVSRIAPKPMRLTVRSPPMVTVPLAAAGCEVGSRVTRRVLSSLERMIR